MFRTLGVAGLFLFVTSASAAADEDPTEQLSPEAAKAEYVRLAQELEKLTSRNAWAGVERTYLALIETGVQPTFEDFIAGASSARATGDISGSRARLMAANELQEDKEILDWLWEIDSNYGKVFLACLPSKDPITLAAPVMPFDPAMAASVRFAIAEIEEDCLFDGYLPKGDYVFGTKEVSVVPRVQSVRIDLRNMDTKRQKKPKKGAQ